MIAFELIAGLVLLIFGAELLVRGASRLASAVGIPPLIVGLTVVAFGTSAPELTVSVLSAFAGEGDVALGNVIGSNIFNVLFILGLSALITPLIVSYQLVKIDVPIMIAVSVVVFVLGLDGQIGKVDGCALFLGIIAYTTFLIYQSYKGKDIQYGDGTTETIQQLKHSNLQWSFDLCLIIVGLTLLVIGSKWLINSSIVIAQFLGVSELIIGLTIVAAGTSLPEVATSVIASIRGEKDIAVGNVVGSNIFNLLAVLGLSGMISPEGINVSQTILTFDIPIMMVVAFACLPIFFSGHKISRWEGGLFFGYYIAYITFLVFAATQDEWLQYFYITMIFFILPLTIITISISVVRPVIQKGKHG